MNINNVKHLSEFTCGQSGDFRGKNTNKKKLNKIMHVNSTVLFVQVDLIKIIHRNKCILMKYQWIIIMR